MADYKVTDTELTSIANAIRAKGGTQAQLEFPTGFVSAIQAIPSGGGSIDIIPKATWDNMTDNEKIAAGKVIVQVSQTGYFLGSYVDGSKLKDVPILINSLYMSSGDTGRVIGSGGTPLTHVFDADGNYDIIIVFVCGDVKNMSGVDVQLNSVSIASEFETIYDATVQGKPPIRIYKYHDTFEYGDTLALGNTQFTANSGVQFFIAQNFNKIDFVDIRGNGGGSFQIPACVIPTARHLEVASFGYYNNGNVIPTTSLFYNNTAQNSTPCDASIWYGGTYVLLINDENYTY